MRYRRPQLNKKILKRKNYINNLLFEKYLHWRTMNGVRDFIRDIDYRGGSDG